ncbi:Crp/Fnr family transcriptional regulator [Polymorphobacter fuscus]|uniref:Helix-turn-helix domain-containing protein n=1 Tax=Sandarakinorhabdus fusca TaxID=1439888 RepID=A0A7C9KP32_9SPHN|nr:Crp/Fnr family transcriptional regulator [Polymorphobacter fuscus]KAB7644917.1 Crp/Fnr family transcriptional regulator [Polymorphobacter fuscus]MQT18204.1 helix-turn-helix domain-containing protein [Polymorphobacter fuscus]NJC09524.1 CRP-like cAMP-binding protein [Polymorphobacter fuscus]
MAEMIGPRGPRPATAPSAGGKPDAAGVGLHFRLVSAGEPLVREGEPMREVHLLADGRAYRFREGPEAQRETLAVLAPTDACTIDALLLARANYSVEMLTPGSVVCVTREQALALVADHPGIRCSFTWLRYVEEAIRAQWSAHLDWQSAPGRTAHLLCELAYRLGKPDGAGGIGFDPPLTADGLADVLALTPVTIERTLQELRAEGLVALARREVVIRHLAALQRVADCGHFCVRASPANVPIADVFDTCRRQYS